MIWRYGFLTISTVPAAARVFVPGNRLQFANLAMERIEVNRLEMDFHGDLELPEGMFVGWSGITYLHPD